MYRLLSVSRNVNLLLSRNDAPALAGFAVVSPRTPEEAPLLAAEREVDAVIIGHSVEHEARNQIALAVRRLRPACLVIFVYALPYTKGDPTADLSVDVTDGPERLIAALRERYRVRP